MRYHLLTWNAHAWKLDILLAYAALLYVSRRPVARVWNRLVHRESGANSWDIIATAAVFGLASGMVQGLHTLLSIAFRGLTEATLYRSTEAIWMAPIGESVSMAALAIALAIVTRAWRRPVAWRLVVLLFGSLAAYGIIRSLRIGIAPVPAWLLAIGFSIQLGRLVSARAEAFRRRLPVLVGGGLLWILTSAALLHGGRALREWTSTRRPAASPDQPSVILFILDTVRASNLSLYGHEHPTTPRLVELANTSAVVDGAVAVSSWTLPSHAAMLTGQLSSALNVDWTKPLGNDYPTVAEELSNRGYATGGFSANYTFASRKAGIARGFSHFVDAPISLDMASENCWLFGVTFALSRWFFRIPVHPQRDAENISDAFLRWVRGQDRPYFAMLNFKDAHTPYLSPDSILYRFVDHRPVNNFVFGEALGPVSSAISTARMTRPLHTSIRRLDVSSIP